MKQIKLVFLGAAAAALGYAYLDKPTHRVIIEVAPPPPPIFGQDLWFTLWVCFVSALAAGAILGVLGGGLWLFGWGAGKLTEIGHVYPKQGTLPVRIRNRATWWERLLGISRMEYAPLGAVAAPVMVTSRPGRDELTFSTTTAGELSTEEQLLVTMGDQRVRGSSAAFGPNGARNAAQAKLAAGYYQDNSLRSLPSNRPAIAPAVAPEDEGEAEPVLEPATAIEKSLASQEWVVLGQQPDGYRDLALWWPGSANTLAIFGSNGTGKTTNAAFTALLVLLGWRWQARVINGKGGGADWAAFASHADVVDASPEIAVEIVKAEWEEYKRRQQVLSAYGASHYSQVPEGERPLPWVTLFEEYGGLREKLARLGRGAIKAFDFYVGELCAEARYTGWHGIFIDQRPTNYDERVKGNLKAIVTYRMAMNQGKTVEASRAGRLAYRGEFEMDGVKYRSFYAGPLVASTLPRFAVRKPQALALVRSGGGANEQNEGVRAAGETGAVLSPVSFAVGANSRGSEAFAAVRPAAPAQAAGAETAAANPGVELDEPGGNGPGRGGVNGQFNWKGESHKYLSANPHARIIDLAAHLASLNGKTAEVMKSTAYKWFNDFYAAGGGRQEGSRAVAAAAAAVETQAAMPVKAERAAAPEGGWAEVVTSWFVANPDLLTGPPRRIDELARTMAVAMTGDADRFEEYRGAAADEFLAFRNSVRVMGKDGRREKMGVDVTASNGPGKGGGA